LHLYNNSHFFNVLHLDSYKKLSYRKQIARQLRTRYVEGIYSNSVTLISGLEVTGGH